MKSPGEHERHCGPGGTVAAAPAVIAGLVMAVIEVTCTGQGEPLSFEVVVRNGKESRHHVTMARETWKRLTAGKHAPEECLRAAFRFLLDREPKEAILRRFDVIVIARYFPEFEQELPGYLAAS
jgi:hypothetical protein